jgi:hypothetical protein
VQAAVDERQRLQSAEERRDVLLQLLGGCGVDIDARGLWRDSTGDRGERALGRLAE